MTSNQTWIFCIAAVLLLAACGTDSDENAGTSVVPPTTSVRVAEVTRGDVQTWVFGEGTARALRREFLSFESAGRIAYVDPNLKEGDRVAKGQLIAYQEKNRPADGKNGSVRELSHAAVRDAAANLELAQKTYNRFEMLLEQRSASQQEYDEAKAKLEQAQVAYQNALIVADESRIVSPINGVVARLNIEQGYYFSPQQIQSNSEAGALSTVPVVIIDQSAFEVSVNLPSFAYHQASVGASVLFQQSVGGLTGGSVNLDAGSNDAIQGTVYAVSPSVDPDTRTFSVKLRTEIGAEHLRDGEYVYAWIAGPAAENAVTIPIGAPRFEDSAAYVFRVNRSTNIVSKVYVTLGLRGRDNRQVLAGLEAGDLVVTDGRSRLSDGNRVRIIGDDPTSRADLPQ